MSYSDYNDVSALIGATVDAILMDEDTLIFQTDRGLMGYQVQGDCCSHSYFQDFYGVKHLLENGPVTAAEPVELSPGDPGYRPETWDENAHPREWQDVIQIYGVRFTTSDPVFGDVSSVVSFRNDSNGYYGGWIEPVREARITEQLRLIEDDIASLS